MELGIELAIELRMGAVDGGSGWRVGIGMPYAQHIYCILTVPSFPLQGKQETFK